MVSSWKSVVFSKREWDTECNATRGGEHANDVALCHDCVHRVGRQSGRCGHVRLCPMSAGHALVEQVLAVYAEQEDAAASAATAPAWPWAWVQQELPELHDGVRRRTRVHQ